MRESNSLLRTLHVVPSLDRTYGGPAVSVVSLASAMQKYGVESRLISVDGADAFNSLIAQKDIPWRRAAPVRLRTGYYSFEFRKELRKEIAHFKPDIVHVHSVWCYPAYVSWRAARSTGRKFVLSPRSELYPESIRRRSWLKRIFRIGFAGRMLNDADMFHATEPAENKAIHSLLPRAKTVMISNGVDLSLGDDLPDRFGARKVLGLNPNKSLILFLSRIHERKGVERLLAAWQASGVANLGWELVIAGEGELAYVERLQKSVPSYLASKVHWLGHVDGDAKRCVFSACDLYVLPSAFENFGIAIAEALACRRPVITSDKTPWASVEAVDAGRIVPAYDIAKLSDAIKEIAGLHVNDRAAMGERGRQLVEPLSWQVAGKQMALAYRELVQPCDPVGT